MASTDLGFSARNVGDFDQYGTLPGAAWHSLEPAPWGVFTVFDGSTGGRFDELQANSEAEVFGRQQMADVSRNGAVAEYQAGADPLTEWRTSSATPGTEWLQSGGGFFDPAGHATGMLARHEAWFGGEILSDLAPLPPPWHCADEGISAETIDKLKKLEEKTKDGGELTAAEWEIIYDAIRCGQLADLTWLTQAAAFLTLPFKMLITWLCSISGGRLCFEKSWVTLHGVTIEIYAHVDEVNDDTSGWTSVDVTAYEVRCSQNSEPQPAQRVKGKMRVEIHSDPDADPPLEWCQFRVFRGGLRLDTDGNGFMEVHINGEGGGEEGEPPIGPPGDAPPGSDPADWPPRPPGAPVPLPPPIPSTPPGSPPLPPPWHV